MPLRNGCGAVVDAKLVAPEPHYHDQRQLRPRGRMARQRRPGMAAGDDKRPQAPVTLDADPAALLNNQISCATVMLAATVSGVVAPETIRVALWKGTVTPAAQVNLAQTYSNVVADPIRPLVCVHAGASSLDVYNVYTGAKTATVASLGAALGTMAISPNGDTLYMFDSANRVIVPLDLATLVTKAAWPLASSVNSQARLVTMHPNGVNIVMTNTNGAFPTSTGAPLGAKVTAGENYRQRRRPAPVHERNRGLFGGLLGDQRRLADGARHTVARPTRVTTAPKSATCPAATRIRTTSRAAAMGAFSAASRAGTAPPTCGYTGRTDHCSRASSWPATRAPCWRASWRYRASR